MGSTDQQSTIQLFAQAGDLYLINTAQSEDNAADASTAQTPGNDPDDTRNNQEDAETTQTLKNIDNETTTETIGVVGPDAGSAVAPQSEISPPPGGHMVIVRDDGSRTGQPKKIICYIHGDLPSDFANDAAFLQQIIDKTVVSKDVDVTTDKNNVEASAIHETDSSRTNDTGRSKTIESSGGATPTTTGGVTGGVAQQQFSPSVHSGSADTSREVVTLELDTVMTETLQ